MFLNWRERERDLCGGLRVIYPSNNWGLGEERQSGATFLSKEQRNGKT